MIVNGASRRSVGFWSKHLENDKKNDRAELKEIRGLAAENLRDALLEMQEDAKNTRLKNFFYQANFNPTAEERLSEEQWQRAFEIFEKHRGIPEGTARIVYEHEKEGRVHRHVIWSRVDTENGRAWSDRLDAKICHAASREISEELGLHRSISPLDKDREGPRPERAPESWEMFRGLKSELDPRAIKEEVTKMFRESENAPAFVERLQQAGYHVVQGDRRDFCIIDSAGEVHSLARRIDGVKAKELREFMRQLPREIFPTVEQAKAHYREGILSERMADLASVQSEIAYEEALYRSAVRKERKEERFVEPTPKQIREREEAEARWPLKPPVAEPSKTHPRFHFEDAARQATRDKTYEPPKELVGMSAILMRTLGRSKEMCQDPSIEGYDKLLTFREAIDRKGIGFARATEEEADRSQREASFARAIGNYTPHFKAGEIVAVRAWDSIHRREGEIVPPGQRVYKLDQKAAKQFVERLGIETKLQGIEPTRQIMKARAAERAQENADRWRESRLENASKRRGAGRTMGERGVLDSFRVLTATKGVVSGAVKAFGAVNTLADMFGSIVAPNQTPEQVRQGEDAVSERKTDGERTADLERFTTSRHFEIQREHDAENATRRRESERER